MKGQYEELDRKWQAALRQISRLRNDRQREAKTHPRLREINEVIDLWKELCNHRNAETSPDRVLMVAPFLEKHGLEMCKRAVRGRAFDHYVTTRKNGTKKRHDGLDLIFRDADHFEESANRAPKESAPPDVLSEGRIKPPA